MRCIILWMVWQPCPYFLKSNYDRRVSFLFILGSRWVGSPKNCRDLTPHTISFQYMVSQLLNLIQQRKVMKLPPTSFNKDEHGFKYCYKKQGFVHIQGLVHKPPQRISFQPKTCVFFFFFFKNIQKLFNKNISY